MTFSSSIKIQFLITRSHMTTKQVVTINEATLEYSKHNEGHKSHQRLNNPKGSKSPINPLSAHDGPRPKANASHIYENTSPPPTPQHGYGSFSSV